MFREAIKKTNFEAQIKQFYAAEFGEKFGSNLGKKILINSKLKGKIKIFESQFFSAIIKVAGKEYEETPDLKSYLIAFLQMLLGASGYDLTEELNSNLFVDNSNVVPFLGEISDVFSIDINNSGFKAIELLMEPPGKYDINEIDLTKDSLAKLMVGVCAKILDNLFIEVIDY